MFTLFGYFDNKAEDYTVLNNIFSSLRLGGTGLIDVSGKECLTRTFAPTTSYISHDGVLLSQRYEIEGDETHIQNHWIFIWKTRVRHFTFYLNLYSGQELREQVGSDDVTLYGNLEGAESGHLA